MKAEKEGERQVRFPFFPLSQFYFFVVGGFGGEFGGEGEMRYGKYGRIYWGEG